MYSQWPRQRFYATPKSHSWERTPWGAPTAGASGASVKSSTVQQGCRAQAALQITGRHTGEMQQGKGRFPSPVLGAGTVGTRRQWVQTPGAPTDSAKPHLPSEGLAGGAAGQLGCSAAVTWERGCVRWAGRGSTRSWSLHLGAACAPALALGPCLCDAAAMSEPGHVPCWSWPADLNFGWTVDLSHPTDMPGDLACWQALATIPGPALLALLCPALSAPLAPRLLGDLPVLRRPTLDPPQHTPCNRIP